MKTILTDFEQTTKRYFDKIGFIDMDCQSTFAEVMEQAKSIGTSLLPYGYQSFYLLF